MKIFKYSVGALGTNAYIILDEKTMEAMLVDPGDEPDKLLNALESKGAHLTYIILTHAHFDHILAIPKIKEKTGASLLVHKDDAPMLADNSLNLLSRFSVRDMAFPSPDRLLTDGDTVKLGDSEIGIIHTPGHTLGSICLSVGDDLISGDTLFRENIGRYDFPGGDFDTIMDSLQR
ncbi:MAG: MBL fold metallo-hydrolase [Clostridia bacterium]|nr:MBL fold metallo-hydrolase [Clostridia bacterium]